MAERTDRSGGPFVVVVVAIAGESQRTRLALIELLNQHARVELVAGPNARAPLTRFTDAMIDEKSTGCDSRNYLRLRNAFIRGAQPDLE